MVSNQEKNPQVQVRVPEWLKEHFIAAAAEAQHTTPDKMVGRLTLAMRASLLAFIQADNDQRTEWLRLASRIEVYPGSPAGDIVREILGEQHGRKKRKRATKRRRSASD